MVSVLGENLVVNGLPVSSSAATGGYWTNNALGCGVSGASGAGMAETDLLYGANSESI